MSVTFRCLVAAALMSVVSQAISFAEELPSLATMETISELDGEKQPILYWAPPEADTQPTPLFVFLHSWSSDYTQDNSKWLSACVKYRWIWIHPNFRGINESPKACGSKYARQDVLDAIRLARQKWNVDGERVYVAGVSGGGHMSLLMAGHHPEVFSAVSSWVGPTDLAEWHRFHTKDGKPERYARMIEASLSGPPGKSAEVDEDYRDRSPVFHLSNAATLPVSIWTGIEDGHTGSVPVSHSLRAFNAIAEGNGTEVVSETSIAELLAKKPLSKALPEDQVVDRSLGRKIFLRRRSGPSLVTVFDGGHESLPPTALKWLSEQRRKAELP